MTVLAIDPDTHATGWALGDERGPTHCGVVKPPPKCEPWERCHHMARNLKLHLAAKGLVVLQAVVEMPGRQGPPHRRGQALYGLAPGVFYANFMAYTHEECHGVTVEQWTTSHRNGYGHLLSKADRAAKLASLYEVYTDFYTQDKGLHAADAVGLLVWWCEEQRVRGVG